LCQVIKNMKYNFIIADGLSVTGMPSNRISIVICL
jgi:hypothetical protein